MGGADAARGKNIVVFWGEFVDGADDFGFVVGDYFDGF